MCNVTNMTMAGLSPGYPLFQVICMYICFVGAVFCVLLNALVIILPYISRKEVIGHYIYYLHNLAFVDIIGALNYVMQGMRVFIPYPSKPWNYPTALFYFNILPRPFFTMAAPCALIIMAIHRRLAVDYGNHPTFRKFFNPSVIIFYCIASDLVCFALSYLNNVTYKGTVSLVATILQDLESGIPIFGIIFVTIIGFDTYRKVRLHSKAVSNTLDVEKLKEHSSVAMSLLANTAIQFFCRSPYSIFVYLAMNWKDEVFCNVPAQTMSSLIFPPFLLTMLTCILTPIMTIIIVKPYKRSLLRVKAILLGESSTKLTKILSNKAASTTK